MSEENKTETENPNDFSIIGKVSIEKNSLGVSINSVTIHDNGKEIVKKIPIHELTWEQIFKPFDKQKVEIQIRLMPTRR